MFSLSRLCFRTGTCVKCDVTWERGWRVIGESVFANEVLETCPGNEETKRAKTRFLPGKVVALGTRDEKELFITVIESLGRQRSNTR